MLPVFHRHPDVDEHQRNQGDGQGQVNPQPVVQPEMERRLVIELPKTATGKIQKYVLRGRGSAIVRQ